MPRVTCFQHIDCEGPGLLGEILKSRNVGVEVRKTYRGDPVPDHPGDGLIVLGGPMGVYEESRFPWMTAELAAVRRCLASSLPVLGICLGSQMLAHAAGGRVFKGHGSEVGWYPVELSPEGRLDPLLLGLPPSFNAFHWHGDTFDLPPGARLLAGSRSYAHQAFKLGGNAYGFQCHLEVTAGMVRSWMEAYAGELTTGGGTLPPGPIEERLSENAKALGDLAAKVFTRWAALL